MKGKTRMLILVINKPSKPSQAMTMKCIRHTSNMSAVLNFKIQCMAHSVCLIQCNIVHRLAQLAVCPHQQIFSKCYPQREYVVFRDIAVNQVLSI